jgi:hypothetical protein
MNSAAASHRCGQNAGDKMRKTSHKERSFAFVVATVTMIVTTGCQKEAAPNAGQIYEGFGNYERTISTESESAQQWFNQGNAADVRVQP